MRQHSVALATLGGLVVLAAVVSSAVHLLAGLDAKLTDALHTRARPMPTLSEVVTRADGVRKTTVTATQLPGEDNDAFVARFDALVLKLSTT